MAIRVSPTEAKPSHDLKLSQSGTEVGLILCDSNGDHNAKAIQRSPFPRSAIKTYSGVQKYSDMEPPFNPIAQMDWLGGRGQDNFDDDATRFNNSLNAITWNKGRILLGGMETYCIGYRSEASFLPGNIAYDGMVWYGLYGTIRYRAARFTTTSAFSAAKIELWIRAIGSPGTLTGYLYTNDSPTNPLTPVVGTTATFTYASLPDAKTSYLHSFTFLTEGVPTPIALSASTSYWVVIYGAATDDITNHWDVLCNNEQPHGRLSADGTTWSSSYFPFFRVTDADAPFVAMFHEYKGQLYFATKPDAGGGGALYMNGYRGAADNNVADLTKLNDSTQTTWDSTLANAIAAIWDGSGVTEDQNWRKITTAAAGVLSCSPAWNVTHSYLGGDTTVYNVVGSDKWTKVCLAITNGPVSDVAVAGELAWYAAGENKADRARNLGIWHEYVNPVTGVWTTEFQYDKITQASFLKAIQDPQAGWVLYLGRNYDADGDVTLTRIVAPQAFNYSTSLAGVAYHSTSPNGFLTEQQDTVTDIASDSFDRADSTTIGNTDGLADPNHTGGSGVTWAETKGDWEIKTNKCQVKTLSVSKAILTLQTAALDVVCAAKVTRGGGDGGVVIRYVDDDNYIILLAGATKFKLIKRVAGSNTTVAEPSAGYTYAAGTEVKIMSAGTRFRVYYGGTQVGGNLTISDAALQTGTLCGLYGEDTGNIFDDFYVYSNQLTVSTVGRGAKIEIAPEFATGLIATDVIGAEDWRSFGKLTVRLNTTKALVAGELQLKIDDTALCASPIKSVDFPAVNADMLTNQEIEFDLSTVTGADAVISVGLYLTISPSAAFDITYVAFDYLYTSNKVIPIGDRTERITGLERYGDPETIWVGKEASLWEVTNNIAHAIPLRAMESVRSSDNFKGHAVHDVYLIFSLGQGLERYFRQNLDDIGPNRDEGMPSDRQGVLVHGVDYPTGMFWALDGGDANYSSVLFWNESGWHEFYRAPRVGLRIRRLHIQAIPGSPVARLWVSQGADVLWLPIAFNPTACTEYRYTHEAVITSSRLAAGLQDVTKFWKSLKLATKNISATVTVDAQYKVDGDTTWTDISDTFDTSPLQEVSIASTNDVTGKWLQYRLILRTQDNTVTPEILASVVETLLRVPVKYAYTITFRLADNDNDLVGEPEHLTAQSKITQLDAWIAAALPITLNSNSITYDAKVVLPEPTPVKLTKITEKDAEADGRAVYVGQCTLVEI